MAKSSWQDVRTEILELGQEIRQAQNSMEQVLTNLNSLSVRLNKVLGKLQAETPPGAGPLGEYFYSEWMVSSLDSAPVFYAVDFDEAENIIAIGQPVHIHDVKQNPERWGSDNDTLMNNSPKALTEAHRLKLVKFGVCRICGTFNGVHDREKDHSTIKTDSVLEYTS